MDLTSKVKEIRKFAKFGLVQFSKHCHERSRKRTFSAYDFRYAN